MNNTQNTLGGACEEIIRRLNGLRTYAKEKSEESAPCDIPGEPVICEICSQWNAGTGWCKKHNRYSHANYHCKDGT